MVNDHKSKVLYRNLDTDIGIEGQKIGKTEEIIYLGQLISFEKKTQKKINRRIALTWRKFWSLKHVLKGPFANLHKSQIFNMCVIPSLIYGSQTWAMNKLDEKR